MEYCFGIDIGGTTIKLGLFEKKEGLLEKWEIPTRKGADPKPLLREIGEALFSCMEKRGIGKEAVCGVGMAAPGPVTADGMLHGTVNIGWGDVFLAEEAERVIGLSPIFIGNDARVAALGEGVFGAGKGAKSLLLLTLGTGVGGGVILEDKIHVGFSGAAGEIGHMTVDIYEEARCSCGKKGCLEQYASATGMVRMAEKFLKSFPHDSLLKQGEKVTAKALWEAAKAKDEAAIAITEKVCHLLGIAIANACYIVDPEVVVIGGGVSAAGEFLLNMVQKAYQNQVFPHCREKAFALAKLRNDAGIYGAAALVFESDLVGLHKKNVLH